MSCSARVFVALLALVLAPVPSIVAAQTSESVPPPAAEPDVGTAPDSDLGAVDAETVERARTDSVAPRAGSPTLGEARFETTQPGLTLFRQQGLRMDAGELGGSSRVARRVPNFVRLCELPCTVAVAPGTQPLAIGFGTRDPELVRGGVVVSPGSAVAVSYRSRRGVRAAGALAIAVGLFGATATSIALAYAKDHDAALAGSLAGFAALALSGAVMASRHDVPRIVPLGVRF